jgi:hypothetical protein
MADPITAAMVGAGISGGTSLLQGKSLGKSLQNAAIGGALGGAGGYLGGAMGGAGGATGTSANPLVGNAIATQGAANMGNIGMANTFNTGAGTVLGQSGTYAQGLNPELYTGSRGMFDVAKGSTLGYNPTFLGGQGPATFAGGGGYDTSLLGGLKRGVSGIMPGDMSNPFGDLTTRDKLGLGLQSAILLNEPEPKMETPQLGLIKPQPTGQYQPTLQARIPQLPRRQILIG